jgi:hypothetical protein
VNSLLELFAFEKFTAMVRELFAEFGGSDGCLLKICCPLKVCGRRRDRPTLTSLSLFS